MIKKFGSYIREKRISVGLGQRQFAKKIGVAASYLNDKILTITKETMVRFGAPQEVISEAIVEASKKNNYSISSQLQGYVFALAFNSLIGLIVAAIMKKTDKSQV